jgi:hypothetical protein
MPLVGSVLGGLSLATGAFAAPPQPRSSVEARDERSVLRTAAPEASAANGNLQWRESDLVRRESAPQAPRDRMRVEHPDRTDRRQNVPIRSDDEVPEVIWEQPTDRHWLEGTAAEAQIRPINQLRSEVEPSAWWQENDATSTDFRGDRESASDLTESTDLAEILLTAPEPPDLVSPEPSPAAQEPSPAEPEPVPAARETSPAVQEPSAVEQDRAQVPSASDLPATPPATIQPTPDASVSNPFERDRTGARSFDAELSEMSSQLPERGLVADCDELRAKIAQRTIEKISLDISPSFRPDLLDPNESAREYQKFLQQQASRPWRDIDGKLIGNGKIRDLAYEDLVITMDDGQTMRLPLRRLSEPDLAYLSTAWGLPRICLLQREVYAGREWLPTTMTWKASALCHKPLYFEEVELERYGHSLGPFAQPVFSTAHFFVNIAVLPYKMGVHTPNECQYALGYYRPGNCAPWIVPPVPISLRGAISQAAVVGAGIWIIP